MLGMIFALYNVLRSESKRVLSAIK